METFRFVTLRRTNENSNVENVELSEIGTEIGLPLQHSTPNSPPTDNIRSDPLPPRLQFTDEDLLQFGVSTVIVLL